MVHSGDEDQRQEVSCRIRSDMEQTDKENRDAIHGVLTRLEAEGKLTPDNVIEEAKARDSPLHDQFTWDLKAAALMTWRSQARALISHFEISVVVHRKEYRIQEFVEAPGKPGKEQGYVAFTRIKNKRELAREFFDRELGIAASYVSKTRDYAQVLGLEKRVERVVNDITTLRKDAQDRSVTIRKARHVSAG